MCIILVFINVNFINLIYELRCYLKWEILFKRIDEEGNLFGKRE